MAANERLIELAIKGLMAERDRVEQEISDLQSKIGRGVTGNGSRGSGSSRPATGRMSDEGRRRISAAMKLRWAKHRQETKSGKPARTSVVAKVGLTDAGRKKLSDMMKKRWAAKRKVAKKK